MMKTLFFGAGLVGSVYAHLLHQAGGDVTVLARGERYDWLKENGLVLINGLTGQQDSSRVKVVNQLKADDEYDLVVVAIRKNKLLPVFEILAASPGVKNVLFMGNNALGFDEYVKHLPVEKLLMGFPGAGGGIREQVVHFADREKPKAKRRAITIGEIDGQSKERTLAVKSLFESAGVPVVQTREIDGWLKYHAALVSPLVGALYKHDCDNYQAAKDKETLRALVRAAKEGFRVLKALGFSKRQPFELNLIYWLPEIMSMRGVRALLESKFAEVAFAMHAKAARDEMEELAREFQQLTAMSSVETPNIDTLRDFII
ncbi:MAG: 2-dehydropantoate 2-reductase N-terminal domain-containing protein [Arenicellales bacterium]|nr:2-dehydropantoate 2-reductase N-terminal domain-containing protein [Arenicellales bacterium]